MGYPERAVKAIKAKRICPDGGVTLSAHVPVSWGVLIKDICAEYEVSVSEFLRNAIELELLKWGDR